MSFREQPFWENGRTRTFSDGRFSISSHPLMVSRIVLRVEADGYQALETGLFSESKTNLTLRLMKAFKPKGVLLGIDGQPAANVTVVFGDEQESFSVKPTGGLSVMGYSPVQPRRITKADGSFDFGTNRLGRFIAATNTGWVDLHTKSWPADGRVQLAPWAKATGVLLDLDGKPAPDVRIAVELDRASMNEPDVRFEEKAFTDASGRFTLERVPPGKARLVRLVTLYRGTWLHLSQTNFTAEPGKLVDLGSMTLMPEPKVTRD